MPRNLIVRVGIDASGYTRGLSKLKQDTRTASEAMAKATAAVGLSQKVAKAQPGTTVNDRVGSMLQAGGTKLITDVDAYNIAEARRQMEDLAAAKTKLEAKGVASRTSTSPDAEKYWQVKGMYEAISESIWQYDAALQEQVATQKAAEDAAVAQAQAQESAAASQTRAARGIRDMSRSVRSARGQTDAYSRSLSSTRRAGSSAADGISRVTRAAQTMARSIRNIGIVSVSLRIAGAAFGRLRSIVGEYIGSNEALQAQVNGLKIGLGQALAPAINMVTNLFSRLMPYALGVANAIGSLMGTLFGGAWNKAAAGANKTAAASHGKCGQGTEGTQQSVARL